jgi:hypothetical protein
MQQEIRIAMRLINDKPVKKEANGSASKIEINKIK